MAKQERFRYGGSKVKTGCLTCKSRRVKCDEKRPTCSQCQRRKIRCEGYQDPAVRRRPSGDPFIYVKFVSLPASSLSTLDAYEKRFFEFFVRQTAPELAGREDGFNSNRWLEIIVPRALSDTAVRHAAIAVGAMHELLMQRSTNDPDQNAFAVLQYNKAVRYIIGLDANRSSDIYDTILTSSILFTIFETMQGRNQMALKHFVGGIKILAQQQQGGICDCILPDQFHGQVLRSIFTYLDTHDLQQIDFLLAPSMEPHTGRLDLYIPARFDTVDQADASLGSLLHDLRRFIRGRDEHTAQTSASKDSQEHWQWHNAFDLQPSQEEKPQVTAAFRQWNIALANSLLPSKSCSVLILRMSHLMHSIILQYNHTLGEVGWDAFFLSYQQIVEFGEHFLLQKRIECRKQYSIRRPSRAPTFTFSRGILQPLTFVALRCRQASVRRHALRLIEQCDRVEASWDSVIAARVAKRVIEIEEANTNHTSTSSIERTPCYPQDSYYRHLPREESRVAHLEKMLTPSGIHKIMYRLSGSSDLYFEDIVSPATASWMVMR